MGLAVASISGCLTTTEVWQRHPGAADSVIFEGCKAQVTSQTFASGQRDVDYSRSGDLVGPFRESWSWSVMNDSYRRFEAFLTVRGVGGQGVFSIVNPVAELVGGDCSPVRWQLQPTAVRQGAEWKVLRYASDYGGVGNWTLTFAAEAASLQYDLRVRVDYF